MACPPKREVVPYFGCRLSLSLTHSLTLSISHSLYVSLSLSPALSLSHSLSHTLSLSLSLCLSLYFSLSVCLPLSLSLSPSLKHIDISHAVLPIVVHGRSAVCGASSIPQCLFCVFHVSSSYKYVNSTLARYT